MDIQKFISKRPFLFHLTDENNLTTILSQNIIYSTRNIVHKSNIENPDVFLRLKRKKHEEINIDNVSYKIRDQKPISEKVLDRSLTNGWNKGDFIAHLNKRVFFWPTIGRLTRHFNTYQSESPVILKFKTEDIFNLNQDIEFCRLNSGATRCSSHWGGNAPERGPDTFLTADNYDLSYITVAEVTVPDLCKLPKKIWKSKNSLGPWEEI